MHELVKEGRIAGFDGMRIDTPLISSEKYIKECTIGNVIENRGINPMADDKSSPEKRFQSLEKLMKSATEVPHNPKNKINAGISDFIEMYVREHTGKDQMLTGDLTPEKAADEIYQGLQKIVLETVVGTDLPAIKNPDAPGADDALLEYAKIQTAPYLERVTPEAILKSIANPDETRRFSNSGKAKDLVKGAVATGLEKKGQSIVVAMSETPEKMKEFVRIFAQAHNLKNADALVSDIVVADRDEMINKFLESYGIETGLGKKVDEFRAKYK